MALVPRISLTMGKVIEVKFPKRTESKGVIILGENGNIPQECYKPGSESQVALKWANQFPAKWKVYDREDGYLLSLHFDKLEDAMEFKNNFNLNVHGIKN